MTQNKQEKLRLLEAMIFAADKPLQVGDMMQWFPNINDGEVLELLKTLRQDYDGRGITLSDNGGFWSFRTAVDLGDQLNMEVEVDRKLSRAAMETLAIIAYHQPMTRAEIENIRGVATGRGTLDILPESGWVKPGRRRETPGRPLTWVTTSGFLSHFGLESITDLPGIDDLKSAGLLDRRPAVQTVPLSGELFDEGDEDAQDGDE
jgi:segregation and condensation protein B